MYTRLPAAGGRVGCGGVLYRVDNRPVVLLCGTVPAYRALHVGVTGPDVRQLNRNLHLGGDAFTTKTEKALEALQRRKGVHVDGSLALGDAVFLPEPVRIAKVTAQVGAPARPGAPVLSATSDKLHVRVELDASQQGGVKKGDRAQITLPGNTPVNGRVAGFGRVAQAEQGTQPAAATIPTFIDLDDPAKAGGLDQAPVQVDITTKGVDDALSVPVTALVGKSGGGFAEREQWDRDALAALRSGDIERFADAYHEHGRIVTAPTAEAAREKLVADWLASHERGERAVMLAHRRRDVAELNERARRALRELGAIGDDQPTTSSRAFAIGDRVVARRNDSRLGVVNGATGRIASITDHTIAVTFADGQTVDVPEAYAHAGHLEHGYALTAHLAQGTTVDRAFILGSDELYREWGYTALSRHREEARFYVSATPAFLNESRMPLETGTDAARAVSRALRASRAQRLALDGVATDPMRDLLAHSLKEAQNELAAIDDAQVAGFAAARSRLRWYERSVRRELDGRIEGWQKSREQWSAEVERLTNEVEARPAPIRSPLVRAIDPLAGIEPRTRELGRGHDVGIER